MFLPMSWTSPLTVAVTIVPARRPVPSRCAARYGIRTATAFFITRALLTTWGRDKCWARRTRSEGVGQPFAQGAVPPGQVLGGALHPRPAGVLGGQVEQA